MAIQLENVSVAYRVPRERVSGIKEYTIRWLQRRLVYEEFRALQNISFQVKQGEVFGIIGRNGSGKSTLLKVVARVLVPQKGRALVRGRVAPLLELGAGFQFELTGRENIYLNSALLGRHQKVTEALLPEIVEFAEIGDFIDAPLRTYSTGMVARLGFAVATALRPEILLVDEVLSVGDAQFQQKCLDRMYNFIKEGTTILFVSHSMATMQAFCDQAVWLDEGNAMAIGPVERVIQEYINPNRAEKATLSPTLELSSSGLDATTVASNLQKYTPFPEIGSLHPATGNLSFRQGSVTGWVRLLSGQPHSHAIIFHTDDSRYILYFSLRYSEELKHNVLALVARAGGNRRMLDPFYGTSSFP
jgi:ABC-type polysaccharide/polyol phosphate transport system ATPase subunit